MKRTKRGLGGASPLISVFYGHLRHRRGDWHADFQALLAPHGSPPDYPGLFLPFANGDRYS